AGRITGWAGSQIIGGCEGAVGADVVREPGNVEDPSGADRRAVVEALVRLVVGGQCRQIELAVAGDVDAAVERGFPAMLWRIAPNLHRQRIVGQLVGQVRKPLRENDRDRARSPAAGPGIVVIFAGEVDEAGRADADADIAGDLAGHTAVEPGVAVVVKLAVAALQLDALAIGANPEVHDAGDRVRAILRGRAVAEHL